jgi:glyoxylase-like metal-dependent hydrolase (beta-lactamase superfamily II)
MANIVGNWGVGAIWRITSGVFSSNAYFCELDVEGGGILIDPGLDGATIDAELSELGFWPNKVFCTHGHFDHTGSASYFQKKYGSQVFLHRLDARIFKSSNFLLMAIKIPQTIKLADICYVENDFKIEIANHQLKFLPAPGHTPGSCVIELGNSWFTGDTIYSKGVGLSKLPGEDPVTLKESIKLLWPNLSFELSIFPGHGEPSNGQFIRTKNYELLNFLGES